jgi:hypothetical protein
LSAKRLNDRNKNVKLKSLLGWRLRDLRINKRQSELKESGRRRQNELKQNG